MARPQPRYKRRIKLIRPRLQLKLVTVFAGIAVLALLLQCLLFYRTMAAMALQLPNDGLIVMSEVNANLGQILMLSLVVLLPATFWIGILVTFRVAGPVYRLETYLKQVARGDRPEDCRLRQGDELMELCAAVNEATRPLRQPADDREHSAREAA
ncbi:MAG: HAMP domain-containing protein [Planctomycetaceae bacterium]|nr:HAMP domain-containing protein [Planctomycetaceae bacterium]